MITPLPTKPSDKNAREPEAGERQLLITRQRDVAALDVKYTKELADAKAENDVGVMMLLVVGCTSKQSVSQCVKLNYASGVDNAASPRLADTAERDYFTLRERLITMQTTGRNPEVY